LLFNFGRRSTDYVKAADRIDNFVTINVQNTRQHMEDEANREVREGISPVKFGWPQTAKIVVLDLTGVKSIDVRKKIVAAARTCRGCVEIIVADATATIVGIRISSEPSRCSTHCAGVGSICSMFGTIGNRG
jgi:hypothetical protein